LILYGKFSLGYKRDATGRFIADYYYDIPLLEFIVYFG